MKNYIIFSLVAIVAILAFREWKHSNRELETVMIPETRISIKAEEIAREVDKEGAEHVIYKEAEPILKMIEVHVEDKKRVDSLLSLANIKENQVKYISTAYAKVSQENIQLKRVLNTATQDTIYQYRDKWLDLSFERKDSALAIGSFKYNFDFNTVSYHKRNWFLGAKKSYTDIWSSDPRVKIRGYDKITIKQDDPQYGLRVQANAVWNPETSSIGYGPGLRVDINRFSIQGKYSYYPKLKEWRPMISGNFDLIRF